MRLTNAPNLKGTATNTPAAILPRGQPVSTTNINVSDITDIIVNQGHRLMIE